MIDRADPPFPAPPTPLPLDIVCLKIFHSPPDKGFGYQTQIVRYPPSALTAPPRATDGRCRRVSLK
jgi:hypothetical protein